MTLRDSFDKAVAAADAHLDDRDLAAIELGRSLALQIDEHDKIYAWAVEDVDGTNRRPVVPQHDNVSRSAFLKVLESLGLTPMSRKTIEAARFAKPTGGADDDSAEATPAGVTSAEEFRRRAAERRPS